MVRCYDGHRFRVEFHIIPTGSGFVPEPVKTSTGS